jgi:hypothetical protein
MSGLSIMQPTTKMIGTILNAKNVEKEEENKEPSYSTRRLYFK